MAVGQSPNIISSIGPVSRPVEVTVKHDYGMPRCLCAMDAPPDPSGDTEQEYERCDPPRADILINPCLDGDRQLVIGTMAHVEAKHYLGLSADTARPPGIPTSPPLHR